MLVNTICLAKKNS